MTEKKIRMFEIEIFYSANIILGEHTHNHIDNIKYYVVGKDDDDAKWWAIEELGNWHDQNGYTEFSVEYCNVKGFCPIDRIVATDMTDNILK